MNNTKGQKTEITIGIDFIKLARSLLEAQKEAQHSQRAFRRAKSLEQMFDAKLQTIEKEVDRLQKNSKPAELPLFGARE